MFRVAFGSLFAILVVAGCSQSQLDSVDKRLATIETATTRPAAVATVVAQTTGSQLAATIAAALTGIVLLERTLRTYVVPAFKKDTSNPNDSSGTSALTSATIPTQQLFTPSPKPTT